MSEKIWNVEGTKHEDEFNENEKVGCRSFQHMLLTFTRSVNNENIFSSLIQLPVLYTKYKERQLR